MNWVDLVIILFLVVFAFSGIGRSFFRQSLDFLSFLFSFVLSLRFYDFFAQIYEHNLKLAHSFATVAGFVSVWILVEVALAIVIAKFIRRSVFINNLDERLKPISFIPSLFRGLILVTILLVVVATFPIQPSLKMAVQSSKLGSSIASAAYELETPLKNVFGGITTESLTFLTVEPQSNESVNLGFKTTNFKPRPDLENEMINLVNHERSIRGLNTLDYDPNLQTIAREHSADMFTRGYFSHYSPEGKTVADRAASHNIDYQVIGENLAYAPNLMLAHNGLMNSPGHRANILSQDYNKIGIGIMDGGVYGLMITQVFSN